MRFVVIVAALSVAILFGGCKPRVATTGEGPNAVAQTPQASEELKGTWQVTSIDAAGKPVPSDRVAKLGLQYVFDGNKVTIRRPDRPEQASTFTLDASVSPKKMTINQTPPVRAVYKMEGNRLYLCVMADEKPDAGYPAEFVSKVSPQTDLLKLERR